MGRHGVDLRAEEWVRGCQKRLARDRELEWEKIERFTHSALLPLVQSRVMSCALPGWTSLWPLSHTMYTLAIRPINPADGFSFSFMTLHKHPEHPVLQ